MNKATKLFYFAKKHPFFKPILKSIMRTFYACDIAMNVNIGENCSFEHNALGTVISSDCTIGNNCVIYHGVTIGAGRGGYPTLGNNVTVFPNSTITGG